MTRLSFCIPTLNRAEVLRSSLDSIIRQAGETVEIVIVEGGSTDNTLTVIEEARAKFPRITLHPSNTRNGVDRDILQSVAAARGEFCWLFSDDDILEDGALARVLTILDRHPDIAGASLIYQGYDATMHYAIATVPAVAGGCMDSSRLFRDRSACFSMLGIHLGFISCQVVRRSLWQEVAGKEDLAEQCNAWIIVYMIGRMMEKKPGWFYLHDICVRYRSGNDSFAARLGAIKRQQITHLSYAHTIGSLFADDAQTYRNVFKVLINDRMARSLAVLKSRGISLAVQFNLFTMYLSRYWTYPKFWLKVIPIFLVPNAVVGLAEKIYRQRKRRVAATRSRIS